jgi:hypothetical protein
VGAGKFRRLSSVLGAIAWFGGQKLGDQQHAVRQSGAGVVPPSIPNRCCAFYASPRNILTSITRSLPNGQRAGGQGPGQRATGERGTGCDVALVLLVPSPRLVRVSATHNPSPAIRRLILHRARPPEQGGLPGQGVRDAAPLSCFCCRGDGLYVLMAAYVSEKARHGSEDGQQWGEAEAASEADVSC